MNLDKKYLLLGFFAPLLLAGFAYLAWNAKAPGPYNLVIISLDTLRADALGIYGNPHKNASPSTDALAKSGVVFEQAFANSSFTNESHMSMFTGLYPPDHGVKNYAHGKALPHSIPTLAEHLEKAGYETAFFGNFHGSIVMAPRFGFSRGFSTFRQDGAPPWREENTQGVRDWLRRQNGNRFFLFVHNFRPHSPYLAPENIVREFAGAAGLGNPLHAVESEFMDRHVRVWQDQGKNLPEPRCLRVDNCIYDKHPWSQYFKYDLMAKQFFGPVKPDLPEHLDALKRTYQGAVAYADSLVGELVQELRSLDLMKNTIVILTSDHGEEFLEHGNLLHFDLNPETLHVPLVMHLPRDLRGRAPGRIPGSVETVDIPVSMLELLGIETELDLDGHSFAGLFRGEQLPQRELLFASTWRGNSDQLYRIVKNGHSLEIQNSIPIGFYDLRKDPQERNNLLASTPANDPVLVELKAEMRCQSGIPVL